MIVVLKNGYKINIETISETIGPNMVPLLHLNGVTTPMMINAITLAKNFSSDNLSLIRVYKHEGDTNPIATYTDYKYINNFNKTYSDVTATLTIILSTVPGDDYKILV